MTKENSSTQSGMLLMIGAMFILPGIDAIAKHLSDHVSAGQITWSRFFFQSIIMVVALLAVRGSFSSLKGLNWTAQMARGFFIAVATLFFFASLKKLPLAEAISIFFVEPLLLTLAAPFFLGERIGWRRICAVIVGLVGALIIVRPSYELFGVYALLPLFAAFLFTFYFILTRRFSEGDPLAMQLGAGLGGVLTMSLALAVGGAQSIDVLTPIYPSLSQWLFLAALGAVATAGHMLIVMALKKVKASILAPFQYLEIVVATVLGFFIFDDFPDPIVWLGIALIIGSGLFVFYREGVRANEAD
ncbi:MAG: DMT family transporter [Alphaproteobacteria bacterium]